MSTRYSANQYDSAFKSQRLQNWCEAKPFKERPSAQVGHTTFIANDRGHLLPGVVKRGSAWSDFKGTWDLPARIPAYHINPTGRSVEGLSRLRSWGFDPQHTGTSQPLRSSRSTGQEDTGKQMQDGVVQSSAAEARASSECHSVTEDERTASQNQDSQEGVAGLVAQAIEDKQATEAPGKDRLLSQGSAAEQGTASETGIVRPVSKLSEKAGSQASRPSSKRHTGSAVDI
ncbi:protein Flattop isoform X2 [Mastacembelus armatus]|uniref:Protein Flattop n=1 Tax=Mastacembelus armatus TaxID=205130 RepID=A0A3Q3MSI9_9TELE|nr:protein Flattop isoform X2 [Mastacembelus armatus]